MTESTRNAQDVIDLSSALDSTNDSLVSMRAENENLAERDGEYLSLDVATLTEKCTEILSCLRTQEKTSLNSISQLAQDQVRRNRSSAKLIGVLER